MSKIVIACLTVATFAYAVWLLVFGRRLPNPKHYKGLRRRFVLATLLFVSVLGATSCQPTCYLPAPPESTIRSMGRDQVAATLQAVWLTLDPECAHEVQEILEEVVGEGKIRKETADVLLVAFSELAYHKKRRGGACCYAMPASAYRHKAMREKMLQQVELLAKVRESGTIDAATAATAQAALAHELQKLYPVSKRKGSFIKAAEELLIGQYETRAIETGEAASAAAEIIVKMAGSDAPEPS